MWLYLTSEANRERIFDVCVCYGVSIYRSWDINHATQKHTIMTQIYHIKVYFKGSCTNLYQKVITLF